MRQIYILFVVLFLFSINQVFSQNALNNYINKNIVRLSKKANVDNSQLKKITQLTGNFNDSQEKKDYKDFRKQIATILSFEDF